MVRSTMLGLMFMVASTTHGLDQRAFDQHVMGLLAEHKLPGLVLHIRHQGRELKHQAYGNVDVEGHRLMKTDDIFRIYSMTKPVTAVAMLQLIDRGLIDFDDDIRKYLPILEPLEYEGQEYVVTIHQLMSHTAGFGYGGGLKNWTDIRYLLANPLSRNKTNEEMVEAISGIDLKFQPGHKFEYSIASDLQGAIIENVTGLSLDAYFEKFVFQPLDMVDTGFYVSENAQARLVDMYEYDASTFEEALFFNQEKIEWIESGEESDYLTKPSLLSAGGGLVSTSHDYANFAQMLLQNGVYKDQRILSEASVKKMISSHTTGLDLHFLPRIYQSVGFGYGVGVQQALNEARPQGSFFWAGMGGTLFWVDPKNDLIVVAMMQVEDGWIALEKWIVPKVYELI